MRIKRVLLVLFCSAIVGVGGCIVLGGPNDLRHAWSRQHGARLHKVFGLNVGGLVFGTVSVLSGHADGLDGVEGIEVGVYVVDASSVQAAEMLDLPGWTPVVTARQGSENVALLVEAEGGVLKGLAVMASDGDKLIIVRIHGQLDQVLKMVFREIGDSERGWSGILDIAGD